MTIDPRKVATTARRQLRTSTTALAAIAKALDLIADEGPRSFQIAYESIPLSTSSSDGNHQPSGSHSDPVLNTVEAGHAAAYITLGKMTQDLDEIERTAQHLNVLTHRLATAVKNHKATPIVTDEQRIDLEKLNSVAGQCECCEHHWATGTPNDRLRNTTVEESETSRMCNACRVAWSRRGYSAPGTLESYAEFRRERRAK